MENSDEPQPRPPSDALLDAAHAPTGHDSLIDAKSLWLALSGTPGVGVSITDTDGRLLYVNEASQVFFSEESGIEYASKNIADFHPPAFVEERLALIRRVIDEDRPLAIRHIYNGRRIESTIWPIHDEDAPFNRVMVITHASSNEESGIPDQGIETVSSQYLDLGPLDVLSPRELEVLVFLGHGMSVPETAAALKRSPKTIEHHKDSIGKKLHARGQSELVSIVTKLGLELDDLKLQRLPRKP